MNVIQMHNLVNVQMVDKRRTNCLLTTVHRGVLGGKYAIVDHGVNTRFNDGEKINLLKPRNDTVRKSCLYMGISLWNTLNLDLRESDIKAFKKNIQKHLSLFGMI